MGDPSLLSAIAGVTVLWSIMSVAHALFHRPGLAPALPPCLRAVSGPLLFCPLLAPPWLLSLCRFCLASFHRDPRPRGRLCLFARSLLCLCFWLSGCSPCACGKPWGALALAFAPSALLVADPSGCRSLARCLPSWRLAGSRLFRLSAALSGSTCFPSLSRRSRASQSSPRGDALRLLASQLAAIR